MRGEHHVLMHHVYICAGSSPHARGARGQWQTLRGFARIIPACAGSTVSVPYRYELERDHPRMRGEHHGRRQVSRLGGGSSPHARGARHRATRRAGRAGIIPACAGSTSTPELMMTLNGDHPRMRGEHAAVASTFASLAGSSPHARGALRDRGADERRGRIIPACAGSTNTRRLPRRRK